MYKIGMFDSGIGGLNVLEEIKKLIPNENIIYYQDSSNNPYGEKTDEELWTIVSNIVEYLIDKGVKEIIVACNTATTRCIKRLREEYPEIIFIGTEPAIKVATDNNYKNIILLGTPGTINSDRLHELVNCNQSDENIYLIECSGLANAIENHDNDTINSLLHNYLDEYKDKNIDSVVLGCTHYGYIKDQILNILGNIKLIDGNLGVAKQAKRMLEENNLLDGTEEGKIEIVER
ncbi:MAG: glutamate racemase [Bacilli bacterium]|nr:glutamate racemase [Bacilli bacterium]